MKTVFSREGLKIVAMITMLIDHIAVVGLAGGNWEVFRCIGRIAFPIFAFQIVEGFLHTSNRKKYLGFIFVFALISEIPYNLITGGIIYPFSQNILFTFALSIIAMNCLEKCCVFSKEKLYKNILPIIMGLLLIGLFLVVGTLTFVSYTGIGVVLIMLFYFIRKYFTNKYISTLLIGLAIWWSSQSLGGLYFEWENFGVAMQDFSILAIFFIMGYIFTGSKSLGSKNKWICYWFYPVHMLLLYSIVTAFR